eukprot:jgi/Tetstr1/464205/TSEL_009010.t1
MGVHADVDGSVTVTFDMVDGGASGVARARVVAVREGSAGLRNQETEVLDAAASGQDVVVSSDLGGNPGSNRAYTFAPGRLRHYSKYFFYLACQDAQGWFNAPPGSTAALGAAGQATGAAIGNNGGLVYDALKPTLTINSATAKLDGTVEVGYTLTESGNSGLAAAKIVASTSPSMDRQAVLDASSGSADVFAGGVDVDVTGTASLGGLANWTTYYVYGVAKDNQGWYSNDSTAPGDGPDAAAARAIDNNGGRTWDVSSPSMSVTEQPAFAGADGRVRVRYTLSDNGNSGIDRAVVYMRETVGGSLQQSVIVDGSGGGVRKAVEIGTDQYVYFESGELKEYVDYRVYVSARDNQGNYNGSLASQDGGSEPVQNSASIPEEGLQLSRSKTRDLTPPAVGAPPGSLAIPDAGNDGATVVISWENAVDPAPASGDASGVAFVHLMATTSDADFDAAAVAAQDSPGPTRRFAAVASPDASASATVAGLQAGATVYGWVAAEDGDGNLSTPVRTSPESITLDSTPPAIGTVTVQAIPSATETAIEFSGLSTAVDDDASGVAGVEVIASSANNASSPSGTIVTGTSSDSTLEVTGLAAGTYYCFVRATDAAGNTSANQDMGIEAKVDGSVVVTYSIGDSGGSRLAKARIVAALVPDGETSSDRNQRDEIINAIESSPDTVVSGDLSGESPPFSYEFAPGRLQPYGRYMFYFACQDAQGWYNSPPGSSTSLDTPGAAAGAPISNNSGRVYDPVKPSLAVLGVYALSDGNVRVDYALTGIGASGLSGARILASTADTLDRDSVLSSSGEGVEAGESGGSVELTGLSSWTAYYVYAVARTNQGWYSNDAAEPGDGDSACPRYGIGNNGGRTWDTSSPSMAVTEQPAFTGTGNDVEVRYSLSDSGDSGIQKAVVYMREGGDASVLQSEVLFGTGNGVRVAVGAGVEHAVFDGALLKEYTEYRVYVAAMDNQGNYNGNAATANPSTFEPEASPLLIPPAALQLGRYTRDLTPPAVGAPPGSLAIPDAGNDGATVVISWENAVDPAPASGDASGVAFVHLMATTSDADFDAAAVAAQDSPGPTRRFAAVASPDASASATVAGLQAGATVYGWVAAEDGDGNLSPAQRTDPPSIQLDITPPTIGTVTVQASPSAPVTAIEFTRLTTAIDDDASGVAGVEVIASSANNASSPSGTIVTGTSSDSTLEVTGLAAGTYYCFVRATDGGGNVSDWHATTPASVMLSVETAYAFAEWNTFDRDLDEFPVAISDDYFTGFIVFDNAANSSNYETVKFKLTLFSINLAMDLSDGSLYVPPP